MLVTVLHAVHAYTARLFDILFIFHDQHTCVAECAEIFRREKRHFAHIAHRCNGAAFVFGAHRLRRVFDE